MNKITVFTRTKCPYCVLLMKFLDMKKIVYETVNIEKDTGAMEKVMAMTGRSIAPTTVVLKDDGTEDVIVGYNLGQVLQSIS
ncbi:MAG TPA: glutaredoxin family protein [Candidatus Saccharimonadales bacterium]|nr:glutaredoxin family protein [Candidatus Saccharimonadales bacterium]